MNKDFLKLVLGGEKKLLALNEVKYVNMPKYDELSVVNLWPEMQTDDAFMVYFPDKLAKGRLPCRTYFFNVMNTLNEGYTQAIMQHANKQRNDGEAMAQAQETIEVNEEWWEKLKSVPFKSCKSISESNLLQNARAVPCTSSSRARRGCRKIASGERYRWPALTPSTWRRPSTTAYGTSRCPCRRVRWRRTIPRCPRFLRTWRR